MLPKEDCQNHARTYMREIKRHLIDLSARLKRGEDTAAIMELIKQDHDALQYWTAKVDGRE